MNHVFSVVKRCALIFSKTRFARVPFFKIKRFSGLCDLDSGRMVCKRETVCETFSVRVVIRFLLDLVFYPSDKSVLCFSIQSA